MPRIESELDPFSPTFRADPYAHYARLRALGRIVWLTSHEIWAVAHHAQVRQVLGDWQRFSNAGGGGLRNHFTTQPWRQPSLILEADPPAHTRTRQVLMDVLSPLRVQHLRPALQRSAQTLIGAALGAGGCEAVTRLVQPYVLKAFGDAVGLPQEDRSNMLRYGAMVFGGFGPTTPWYEELMQQAEEVTTWIMRRCQRDALAPGGFGAAIYQQADAGRIEPWEAPLLVRSLLSAGTDTTIDSIGLCLLCLATHPQQWQLLRADPGLARGAFEEATRYDSSSQSLFRTTLQACEFEGATLARHQKVLVLLGSAGRDCEAWPDPDRFDIMRHTLSRQLGFGTGIHACVAQLLARQEAEVFLQTLAASAGTLEVSGTPQWRLQPGLRGLTELPLRLAP